MKNKISIYLFTVALFVFGSTDLFAVDDGDGIEDAPVSCEEVLQNFRDHGSAAYFENGIASSAAFLSRLQSAFDEAAIAAPPIVHSNKTSVGRFAAPSRTPTTSHTHYDIHYGRSCAFKPGLSDVCRAAIGSALPNLFATRGPYCSCVSTSEAECAAALERVRNALDPALADPLTNLEKCACPGASTYNDIYDCTDSCNTQNITNIPGGC